MKLFKDKVVWITGASSGFGEAMAEAFSEQGAKIILSSRRVEELKRVKDKIGESAILPLDLMHSNMFKEKTEEAITIFGQVDIVIHNGGIAQNSLAIDTKPEVQRRIMDVDFFSYTEITQYLLPHFIERNAGHIVVVSGVLAKVPMPMRTSYCAAKAALHGYFDSLRGEVLKHNIDVTILVPSFLNTSLAAKAVDGRGNIPTRKSSGIGCPVNKAAKQVVKAVRNKKYTVAIGDRDKGRFLLWLSRIFPTMATNIVLKQAR